MKMIPSTPYSTKSSAERLVFDRLRGACEQGQAFEQGQERLQPLTAFHSMNLTRHAYKRIGEADFVIVGLQGILVLEVKGGGIACHAGVWYSTDRTGTSNRLPESPFRQAETAMYGLRKRLEAALPPVVCDQFVWGYGVVFPGCDWSVIGAEWEQAMVADFRAAKNMERWLSGLYRYWRQRDNRRHEPASAEALSKVIKFLRPDADALAMLASRGAARMPLKRNCRNTLQILSEVQSALGADLGVRGTGDGPEVVRHRAKTKQHAADLLAAEIERLTSREGLSLPEITILSPRPFPDSAAALLPAKLASDITELDEFALRDFPPARISFAEIANFKGLENEAVILIDLPREAEAPRSFTDSYVGMSRARSLLITVAID